MPQHTSCTPRFASAALAWQLFTAHAHELLAPLGTFEPLMEAQYTPQWFWNAAPFDEIEAWARSKVLPEMAPVLVRDMSGARRRC